MFREPTILTLEQLEQRILEWGFLPFFKNGVEGFSVEELVPEDLLFGDNEQGNAWEWKGPIISHWQCAYGKFFNGKVGYVSLDWLPDFMSWRRYRFSLKKHIKEAKHILEVLKEKESMLSKELKIASGYSLSRKRKKINLDELETTIVDMKNGPTFDSLISSLQMGTYMCVADFEYKISKKGVPYGWGEARYCTPEAMYEFDFREAVDGRLVVESYWRIIEHIQKLFPDADVYQIKKLIGW
ncbi:MAG: hypothetical protein LUD48_01360 [Prevotella sp.]|nr:hypothetical protein [Prevotella sp.]